jgi:argininosuccinate lyase
MPQKKNPDTMELVRATAGDAAAGLNALLTLLKGLPRAYNRDLQRAHPHAFEAVDAATEATEVAAGAVATADWREATLADAAGEGFSTATGVADLLAMQGLPFRTAHQLVARAAQGASEAGTDYEALDDAAREVLDEPLADVVDREAVEAALDPVESVASRDSLGGPAPSAVEAALERARHGIGADVDALEARRTALDDAAERRRQEVERYA